MDDERHFEGGKLVLFTRNGIWQARVAIGNRRYLWKTLKTSNEADAKRAGFKLFHLTEHKIEEGLPVQSRSFSSVIDEFVAHRERDHNLGKAAKRGSSIKHTSASMLRQIKRVSKFWHEYAGKRATDAIDDKVLRDFIPWRKAYYHDKKDPHPNAKLNPTDKTLQWEIMLGKMILKYAQDQRYRGNKPLPTFAFTPKTKRVRPHFTGQEFRKLPTALRNWIDATDNPAWKASRQLLHDYIHTLGMAGLRTGEANNLRVRDMDPITDVETSSALGVRPRQRADALGEGFTNADAVIGQFDFDPRTRAGLRLAPKAKQFVVVEAKMFSNFSLGTTNAPNFNQAARNVACMAAAIEHSGRRVEELESLGFFVVAPLLARRRPGHSNLESCVEPESIKLAVRQRIGSYEATNRPEAKDLIIWERDYFLPLVDCLAPKGRLAVLSWEDCIAALAAADAKVGEELQLFYERCLTFAPSL